MAQIVTIDGDNFIEVIAAEVVQACVPALGGNAEIPAATQQSPKEGRGAARG